MKIFLILFLLLLIGCTNADQARRVLEVDGFTDVEITGYSFFGCGRDDVFHTQFTAKKNGHITSGVVCSGFLKGATIRF